MTKAKAEKEMIRIGPPKKTEKGRTLSFRTTDEIASLIEAIAEKNHRTMSQQICMWVEGAINL